MLFAAIEVGDGAVRHMPDIAHRRGVGLEVVEKALTDVILPSVRFGEVGADTVEDPRLDGVDPEDLPSARLAALLAPAVLATDNRKHYRPFAIPNTKPTRSPERLPLRRWTSSQNGNTRVAGADAELLRVRARALNARVPPRRRRGLIASCRTGPTVADESARNKASTPTNRRLL